MSNFERPLAILFDRDGTLASIHNGPKKNYPRGSKQDNRQWAEFNAAMPFDAVVPEIAGLLRSIRPGIVRIMVSGRAAGNRQGENFRYWQMWQWITKHQLPIDYLFMRQAGDQRRDSVVKEEILINKIFTRWNPIVAVDDREEVCEVWEKHGIHVIRVTNPGILPSIGA